MQVKMETMPAWDEVKKRFKNIPARIEKGASRALMKAAFMIEKASKQWTPVDTGRLRASIWSDIHPMYATIQPKTDYAVAVHEGTKKMKGRPFMKQGVEEVQDEIQKLFGYEIATEIKKIIK